MMHKRWDADTYEKVDKKNLTKDSKHVGPCVGFSRIESVTLTLHCLQSMLPKRRVWKEEQNMKCGFRITYPWLGFPNLSTHQPSATSPLFFDNRHFEHLDKYFKVDLWPCGKQRFREIARPDWVGHFTNRTYCWVGVHLRKVPTQSGQAISRKCCFPHGNLFCTLYSEDGA